MDDPGNQPLTSVGFTLQQERRDEGTAHGVEGDKMADLGAQRLKGECLSDEAVGGMDG
jgi:hypothetical protein